MSWKKIRKAISNPSGKLALTNPWSGVRYLQKKITHSKALAPYFGNGSPTSAYSFAGSGGYGMTGSIVGRY